MRYITNTKKYESGFTMLVAMVTTSLLLVVSFVVVNMAFRQLIISDANEESQYAFYNADSGLECAIFWDLKHTGTTTNPFNPSTLGNISCNNVSIPISSISRTNYTYHSSLNAYISTSTFSFDLTKGCVSIDVVKNQTSQITKVNSRGYNTCAVGASRKYERGITITFPSYGAIPVNVTWKNVVGVTATGNSLSKPGGASDAWDTGASSNQAITSGDGYIEFSTNENNIRKMASLSNGDPDQNYTGLDFTIHMTAAGTLNIYENGVVAYAAGNPNMTYSSGDVFKIAIENGVVKYYKNGTILLYTSSQTPVYPLLFDTSMAGPNGTINNAKVAS